MGSGLIAFIAGIGIAGWLYPKFMRRTGNNTNNSLIAVVIIGVMVFAIGYYILNMILP